MNEYRQRFDELYQFFAGYFHQDWSRVFDWKESPADFRLVVRHFKAVNPKMIVARVRNQLEDFLSYDLTENDLKDALLNLGCNYYPKDPAYRNWLNAVLGILNDPTEKGEVLREIE